MALLRAIFVNDPSILFTANMYATIAGTASALLAGLSICRGMARFAGTWPGTLVLASFGLAYAAIFAACLSLRLDCS